MGVLLLAGVLVSHAATYQIIAQVPIPSNASEVVDVNETLNKIYVSGGASGGQQTAVIDGNTFALNVVGSGSSASVDTATNRYWAAGVYDGRVHVREM